MAVQVSWLWWYGDANSSNSPGLLVRWTPFAAILPSEAKKRSISYDVRARSLCSSWHLAVTHSRRGDGHVQIVANWKPRKQIEIWKIVVFLCVPGYSARSLAFCTEVYTHFRTQGPWRLVSRSTKSVVCLPLPLPGLYKRFTFSNDIRMTHVFTCPLHYEEWSVSCDPKYQDG
jgi:hypothetical protein